MKKSAGTVARIRARYNTRHRRIFIRIPALPILPEENQGVENLFDLKISYVKFSSLSSMERFLRPVLQVDSTRTNRFSTPSQKLVFPVEFENATVREIAAAYAQGGILTIEENHTLLLRESYSREVLVVEHPQPLLERIKKRLGW